MASHVTIDVSPSEKPQTIILQLETKPNDWLSASVYAPAIPGVAVALLGLWVAHRFTVVRDRRKENLDLAKAAKDALHRAEDACIKAWLSNSIDRSNAVADAKSSLQALGIIATDLKRRTRRKGVSVLIGKFINGVSSVDVVNDIGGLRDIATGDPFDDNSRDPDLSRISDISAKATEIHARIDEHFHDRFG